MMISFRETTFWAKRSLSFVFRGPNSVHADIFRCVNHNGTSFKAVWWSVSEKLHFELKHHFPLYLEGQTQCILKFSGVSIIMVQEVKVYDDLFQRNHILLYDDLKTTFWSLSFVFRGPNSVHPEVFRCANHNGTNFKAVWWSVSEKPHFGLKHHFPLYLEGQTQCMLKFSGVPITMVQISKLYDDLFQRNHILG